MWLNRNRREAKAFASLYASGQMKPFVVYCQKEIGKTNKISDTSDCLTELIKAQSRRETLREILRLGKDARKFLTKSTR